MPKATSFYVDCTHEAGSLEYTDGHAEGCTKIYDLWKNRRVTDKGPDLAPCTIPDYIHGVDTGEWAECCRRQLMHPDDEQGPLKNVLKLLVALGLRKGYKEVYICQALKAESHNYAYDMDSGLGWIKDSCGDCGGSDEVCLKPRVFDIKSTPPPKGFKDRLMQAAKSVVRKLIGMERNICLGVGYNWSFGRIAPGLIDMVKSLPWGDKRKVYYINAAIAPCPLLPQDLEVASLLRNVRLSYRRQYLRDFL
ncbi:unnamed protein product [Cladocopium goreaui]|uniref:Uncharacterized protein n=1 Tax=Cladocopium goreaui TaxID=2562237 RepID=A0A9P1GS01_9DINO|nr:unnamed protein product [Cladocopium goreaui]